MGKKNSAKAKVRHMKWMEYYAENFGIWIECSECKKWRTCFLYQESHEVPERWQCSLQTLENGQQGSCNDPQEDNSDMLSYCPGSVVWAKLGGYPWWPAMVDGDPKTSDYTREGKKGREYKVTFLDEKPSHSWIPEISICSFLEAPKVKKGCPEKWKQIKHAKRISEARKRAKAAIKMKLKERLQKFSFVYLYEGPWRLYPSTEECTIEEYGSKKVKHNDDIISQVSDEHTPDDSGRTEVECSMEKNVNRNVDDNDGMIFQESDEHVPSESRSTEEECPMEENGNRNVEDNDYMIFQESDERMPSDSTSTDGGRMEQDLSREDNTADENIMSSGNSVIRRSKKKTLKKKWLIQDFIKENKKTSFRQRKDFSCFSPINRNVLRDEMSGYF